MKSLLTRIKDWDALAQSLRYNVAALAGECGATVRQLERYFVHSFGKSPHQWLHDLRLRRAVELLKDGTSAKATSIILGYKDDQHFNHDFRKYYGIPPGDFSFGAILTDRGRILTTNVAF